MSEKRRTMADADKASARRFYIGFGIIIAALMFITYTGIPSNFFHDWFVSAGNVKYLSIVSYLAAFIFVFKADQLAFNEKSGGTFGFIAALLVVLSICLSAGFVFDLK